MTTRRNTPHLCLDNRLPVALPRVVRDRSMAPGWLRQARCLALSVVAWLLLAQAAPVAAQKAPDADPATIAAARELMDAAGATKQFDAVVPALVHQMTGIFVQQQPAYEKTIREAFAGIAVRMSERKDELLVEIAKLYAQQFSLDELRELTQFFTSGVGKRFVEKQLVILPQSMAIGQRWGARIGSEVDAEMRKELRKRGVPI